MNCYQDQEQGAEEIPTSRPDPEKMKAHVERFKAFKAARSQSAVDKAIDGLVRAAHDENDNVFARVIEAAEAGATHGEIIACLREELGFGHPLVVA